MIDPFLTFRPIAALSIVLLSSCAANVCPDIWRACFDRDPDDLSALEEVEERLSSFERRLRAVEQPVWQIGTKEEDWEVCAEGPCRCIPETKSLSCWRFDLLDVPPTQVVPSDILKLDLGSNQLTALHRDIFLGLTRLTHLDLSNNFVEHLPLNLFFSLHAVTHARISKNLLRELHRNQFLRLRNLRILDISSNRLTTLPENLFLTTIVLTLLDVSFNHISSLPAGTFQGLRSLEELLLNRNRLVQLPDVVFRDLVALRFLRLDENRLKRLPDDLFQEQVALKELYLRDNHLTEISRRTLLPLKELVVLDLSNNRITHIDPAAFYGLASLKELQLGQNRIKTIPANLFRASGSLERLMLYANAMETLQSGAFRGLTGLVSLYLHSNRLRIVHPDLFKDTPSLRKLQLEGNFLTYLPARILDAVPDIEQLRLARNPWHCDCSAAYMSAWLKKRYTGGRANVPVAPDALPEASAPPIEHDETVDFWEFGGGAVCRGPGTLGGRMISRLTFHELCEGQWASMKGLVPRLPVETPSTAPPNTGSAARSGPGGGPMVVFGSRAHRDALVPRRPGAAVRFSAMATSDSGTGTTVKVLEDLLRILKEEKVFGKEGELPVVRFRHPADLKEELSVNLGQSAASGEEIDTAIRQIVRYSVKTFSPHFHNQLYAGVDEYGLAGAWLTDVFNTSQYTFEVAPVFTLMEREVIERSLELVGYPPMPDGDGILSPGGSLSNMYAMVLARYKMLPEVKRKGLGGQPPLACFTSEDGHYSILKGAHWLGLGTDNVYKVKSDSSGRMIPSELKKAIRDARSKGQVPFFVNATCGTTVLGAIDPLEDISTICQAEGLWLHADACLGGTLLLSGKYRGRLRGIEMTNSVAWNPHKMLGAPFQCSLFLVKGKNALHEANCAGARYLFQQDKFYDVSWDTGDKSLQCGRKVDGMKFWLMWKARGTLGLTKSVEDAMSAAEYFFERIKTREHFRLVLPEYECCNICFWYIPPSMRNQEETKDWWERLYATTARIKERMLLAGALMIGYTPLSHKNIGNFFRMVVTCQPPPTRASMYYVIEQIEKFGGEF